MHGATIKINCEVVFGCTEHGLKVFVGLEVKLHALLFPAIDVKN